MSNVLAFPNRRVSPVIPMQVDDSELIPMENPPVMAPVKPMPKVVLAAPVFANLLEALGFYAASGFDHGKRANEALGAFNPQPQESA